MKRITLLTVVLLNLHFLFAHELLDVASGTRHSLLLFDNGKILPFGDNGHGQLGLSKTIDYQSISEENPLYVDTPENFISVAAGLNFSLAVSDDGGLWGWGNNHNYQLGLHSPRTIEKPQLLTDVKGWKKVFAGGYESLALKDDGTLWNLRNFEIIKNPNGTIWKDVNIYGEVWGWGDYTSIIVLQDIDNKFWVYGTCLDSLDNFSIINSFIDKETVCIDSETILPIKISSDTTRFQVTDLSGIYQNKSDTVIFGLSVADDEKMKRIKEPVYDYLSGITVNENSEKINEIVIGNFTDMLPRTSYLFQSQFENNLSSYFQIYSALLQKNGKLVIYTNGKKMISDGNIKIKKIFGGSNIFVQGKDLKIYGIGYFYAMFDHPENVASFRYFIPINF